MDEPKDTYRTRGGSLKSISDSKKRLAQAFRSAIRQVWLRYAYEREAVLSLAQVEKPRALKNGSLAKRGDKFYTCAGCQLLFPVKEIKVDHKDPVGGTPSLSESLSIGQWIARLFVAVDGLQCLCTSCHQYKTNEERRNAKSRKVR